MSHPRMERRKTGTIRINGIISYEINLKQVKRDLCNSEMSTPKEHSSRHKSLSHVSQSLELNLLKLSGAISSSIHISIYS